MWGKSMPSNSTLRQESLLPGTTHTSGPAWPAAAVICVSSLAVSDQHGRGWQSPVSNLEWTAWASSNSVASRVTSVAD
jgi:hypothetical protein